jgi:hypothetical protein
MVDGDRSGRCETRRTIEHGATGISMRVYHTCMLAIDGHQHIFGVNGKAFSLSIPFRACQLPNFVDLVFFVIIPTCSDDCVVSDGTLVAPHHKRIGRAIARPECYTACGSVSGSRISRQGCPCRQESGTSSAGNTPRIMLQTPLLMFGCCRQPNCSIRVLTSAVEAD